MSKNGKSAEAKTYTILIMILFFGIYLIYKIIQWIIRFMVKFTK